MLRRVLQILLAAVVVPCVGCDLRQLSPRWHSLTKKGVSYVPGSYDSASYLHGATDEQFAEAVEDLRKTKVKNLNFQNTRLTDKSIDGVVQIGSLEVLYVNGTNFTADGLVRLKGLPRLRRLYIAEGQFTEEEQDRIRSALSMVDLRLTPTGAYRFKTPSNGSRGTGE